MTSLVEVRNLSVRFFRPHTLRWRPPVAVDALRDISLTISVGESVGLVGESGSGKSTLGSVLLGNQAPTEGRVRVGEWDVAGFKGKAPRAFRRAVQVVWQDPYASLTPGLRIRDLLAEPLVAHFAQSRHEAMRRVDEMLELVGLSTSAANKFPHEYSGGQRQRIAIARALSLNPSLLVLDEPVSALDLLTQAQILTLLREIREKTGMTYLFISHDLGVVRWLCQRMIVLRKGSVVECGEADNVCDRPQAEYTRQLVASIL